MRILKCIPSIAALGVWAAILCLISPAGATTASYTFNHSGNLPNPPWTLQDGTLMTESGGSLQSANFTNYNSTYWNSNSFGAAQFTQLTLGTSPSGFISLILRANGSDYYISYYESGAWQIERNVAGSHTGFHSFTMSAWASGDVLRVEVDASYTFKFSLNGTVVDTFSDPNTPAALASGQPGVGAYNNISGVASWTGGDVGGAGPTVPAFHSSLLGVGF